MLRRGTERKGTPARARVGRGGAPPRRGGGVGGRGSRARAAAKAQTKQLVEDAERELERCAAQGGHRSRQMRVCAPPARGGGGPRARAGSRRVGVGARRRSATERGRGPRRKGDKCDGKGLDPGVPGDMVTKYPRNIRESRGGATNAAVDALRREMTMRRSRPAENGKENGKEKEKKSVSGAEAARSAAARVRAREREAANAAAAAATAAAARGALRRSRARAAGDAKNPSVRVDGGRRRRSSRRRSGVRQS